SFAIVVYVGYAGLLAALVSRRAMPIFIGASALVGLLATIDVVYLAFDVAPSELVARLGAIRFYMIVRPFVFLGAGYAAWLLVAAARAQRPALAARRTHLLRNALLGVGAALALRFGCQTAHLQVAGVRVAANHRVGHAQTEELLAWARTQMASAAPDRFARAVFESEAYYAHATAMTGLPAFHIGPIPDVLLRERIDDLDPSALRRYNVRWIVSDRPHPLPIGDPMTERTFGHFTVREIAGWDGQFARVERGAGRALTTRLDNRAVDVKLVDTDAPALVVLGTSYYPRWRAVDAAGRAIPVYAYPGTNRGATFVVAAWLPPNTTTRFTPDGPLACDGAGRLPALAALAMCVAIVATFRSHRRRTRALHRYLAIRTRIARIARMPSARAVTAALAGLALVLWGAGASVRPVGALELGSGLRATAEVSFKTTGGAWQPCAYERSLGQYHCGDRAIVVDTTDALVNNEQVMWPFTTPAIAVYPMKRRYVEVRIELTRRLAGRYLVHSSKPVDLTVGRRGALDTTEQQAIDLDDDEHAITITTPATSDPLTFTFVRTDTLEHPRVLPLAPSTPAF
ncbi:MAG TPA: hypothetical protein VK427_00070, partial [Kofleriaceae bacterium]|nr:hypothetical protein [Kofleriaceae bacterium]